MTRKLNQHGDKGVYLGGNWLPIEECVDKFNINNDVASCSKNCDACPRSKTRSKAKFSSEEKDKIYDVVIVGAGCIGGAIARELSKTNNSVLLLEGADDISQGATKGNSGIVHAGFDDTPGSNRAKFCWKGNQMFPKLDEELRFGFQKNGSLVLAKGQDDEKHLLELKARGEKNGVERLRIINKEELFQLEPHVHPDCTAALLSPDAGNIIPYEYTIALIENAVDNGVELKIRRQVQNIEVIKVNEKSVDPMSDDLFLITVNHWEPQTYIENQVTNIESNEFTMSSNKMSYYLITITVLMIFSLIAAILAFITKQSQEIINSTLIALFSTLILTIISKCQQSNHTRKKASTNSSSPSSVQTFITNVTHAPKPQGGNPLDPNNSNCKSGHPVTVEDMKMGGSGSITVMNGKSIEIEKIKCRYLVNAAGCASDKIAAMLHDTSFTIKPRVGDYLLLNRNQGYLTSHTLFPCPGPLGKGVLVQTTLWGNLILGPTARDMHIPEIRDQSADEIQTFILSKCKELVPDFDVAEVFHSFSGARAKSTRGDWIIEASPVHPKFIYAAGIDSPGLAGSPAIAIEIVRLLQVAGLSLNLNPSFNPNRRPLIEPKNGWKNIQGKLMGAGPVGKFTDPETNIICKCEKVTESEVIRAVRGSVPVDSTQAVRKRVRAGMGSCQADEDNYNCESRVAAIIARELNIPVQAVGRRPWPATSTLPQRWITEEQKQHLQQLKQT